MKKIALLLCVASLSACASVGTQYPSASYAAAIGVELGAQIRCPNSLTQWNILTSARISYDVTVFPGLSPAQQTELIHQRALTDATCPRV